MFVYLCGLSQVFVGSKTSNLLSNTILVEFSKIKTNPAHQNPFGLDWASSSSQSVIHLHP